MYDCEICGKPTEALYVIEVEGAELSVCAPCSMGKKVIEAVGEAEKIPRHQRVKIVEEEEIVEGYGEVVRKAREILGIPIRVLGEMINEKESTLQRVEKEQMQPNLVLTAKLEKALGIRLTTRQEKRETKPSKKDQTITLGEAAEKKDKR